MEQSKRVPQRLTWNGGCDRWLDRVGLLHEGLDAGDRGRRESETTTAAAATSPWPWPPRARDPPGGPPP